MIVGKRRCGDRDLARGESTILHAEPLIESACRVEDLDAPFAEQVAEFRVVDESVRGNGREIGELFRCFVDLQPGGGDASSRIAGEVLENRRDQPEHVQDSLPLFRIPAEDADCVGMYLEVSISGFGFAEGRTPIEAEGALPCAEVQPVDLEDGENQRRNRCGSVE